MSTCLLVRTMSLVDLVFITGAKFGMSLIDNWNIRPKFLKDDNKCANFFIIGLFSISYLGSLPSKIAALRYFTFVTAIINLLLGGVYGL